MKTVTDFADLRWDSHQVSSDSGIRPLVFLPRHIDLGKCLWAEFLGCFLFQFLGGAIFINAYEAWWTLGQLDHIGASINALGNGFALATLVYGTYSISGGHLNPAVSVAFALLGLPNFSIWTAIAYAIAQILGAGFGAVLLFAALPPEKNLLSFVQFTTVGSLANNHWKEAKMSDMMGVFVGEYLGTALLVLTYFAMVHSLDFRRRVLSFASTAPLVIGLAQVGVTFAIGYWTGASCNPARTVAPWLIYGFHEAQINYRYFYFLQLGGIFAGSLGAAKFYTMVFIPVTEANRARAKSMVKMFGVVVVGAFFFALMWYTAWYHVKDMSM